MKKNYSLKTLSKSSKTWIHLTFRIWMLSRKSFNFSHPKLRNYGKIFQNWWKSQDTPKHSGMMNVDFHLIDIDVLGVLKTGATSKAWLREQNTSSLTTKFKKLLIKSVAYGNLWVGSRNTSFQRSKLSSMKDVHILSLKIFGQLYTILLILLRCKKLISTF